MEILDDESQIFRAGDAVVYIGKVDDEEAHSHLGIQLIIGLDKPFEVKKKDEKIISKSLVIRHSVEHSLDSKNENVLILWINPASTVGLFLNKCQTTADIESFEEEWTSHLRLFAQDLLNNDINASTFVSAIVNSMAEFNIRCLETKYNVDKHVMAALQYLDRHTRYIISSEDLAEELCMEEKTLLKLMEGETGMSFLHLKQWKKLLNSFESTRNLKDPSTSAAQKGVTDKKEYLILFVYFFGISPPESLLEAIYN
jgi:AraC-like DNA-binding protein